MRLAALSLFAVTLAACGGTAGTVTAPSNAPEGASEMMSNFFEICSSALNDSAAVAVNKAVAKGWTPETNNDSGVLPLDIMRQYQLSHENGIAISIYEHDGPHDAAMGCQAYNPFGEEDLLQVSALEGLTGFEGRWMASGEAGGGRWSKRGVRTIVSISATMDGDRFSMVSMNKVTLK